MLSLRHLQKQKLHPCHHKFLFTAFYHYRIDIYYNEINAAAMYFIIDQWNLSAAEHIGMQQDVFAWTASCHSSSGTELTTGSTRTAFTSTAVIAVTIRCIVCLISKGVTKGKKRNRKIIMFSIKPDHQNQIFYKGGTINMIQTLSYQRYK